MKKGGFTLIEIIIYTAILALIFALVVNSLAVVIKAFNQGRLAIKINNSAEVAVDRMVREIRAAYDIDGNSVFDSHPGRLILITDSLITPGSTTTLEFNLDLGRIMVEEEGDIVEALTSSDLTVTNLVFRQISASSTSKAIKIEMEIHGLSGNYQKTENFYNTAILRKSY
ncbi:MAG: type II secretion system protein [Patescibacteria group bacterium]